MRVFIRRGGAVRLRNRDISRSFLSNNHDLHRRPATSMTGVDSSDTQHNEAAVKSTTESAIEGVAGYDVGPHVSESLVESNSRKPTATAMQESVAADSEGNLYSENPFADTNGRDGQVEGAPNSPSRPVEPNEQITGSVPPEIEGLKAMFPDFDVAILSVNYFFSLPHMELIAMGSHTDNLCWNQ